MGEKGANHEVRSCAEQKLNRLMTLLQNEGMLFLRFILNACSSHGMLHGDGIALKNHFLHHVSKSGFGQ